MGRELHNGGLEDDPKENEFFVMEIEILKTGSGNKYLDEP